MKSLCRKESDGRSSSGSASSSGNSTTRVTRIVGSRRNFDATSRPSTSSPRTMRPSSRGAFLRVGCSTDGRCARRCLSRREASSATRVEPGLGPCPTLRRFGSRSSDTSTAGRASAPRQLYHKAERLPLRTPFQRTGRGTELPDRLRLQWNGTAVRHRVQSTDQGALISRQDGQIQAMVRRWVANARGDRCPSVRPGTIRCRSPIHAAVVRAQEASGGHEARSPGSCRERPAGSGSFEGPPDPTEGAVSVLSHLGDPDTGGAGRRDQARVRRSRRSYGA